MIGLLVAATVSGQGKVEGRGPARRFSSEKYGFSIKVPSGWLVDPSNDTPMYFSFSPAEAGDFNHQLKIPRGGAAISIVAQDTLPGRHARTPAEWALADSRGVSSGTPSLSPFEMPPESGATDATISTYDSATFGPDDQSEHRVNLFWDFRQKLFAAHLLYPAHDPKGPMFERIFADTVRSILPLESLQRH
jgi:hypothetical protein